MESIFRSNETKKRTVAALVQEGKPISFNGNELQVGFPPNLKFHMENLGLPQNKELMESVLKDVCGSEIKIFCIPLSQASANPTTSPPGAAPQGSSSLGKRENQAGNQPAEPELLAKARTMFGGEIQPIPKEEK